MQQGRRNIYNKIYHYPNGTLEDNWYEERCLRDKTNEGRTLIPQHIPKKFNSWDTKFDPNTKINNTFKRTIGDRPYNEYTTTYSDYGNFEKFQNFEKKIPMKDKIYNSFFDRYKIKNDDIIAKDESHK